LKKYKVVLGTRQKDRIRASNVLPVLDELEREELIQTTGYDVTWKPLYESTGKINEIVYKRGKDIRGKLCEYFQLRLGIGCDKYVTAFDLFKYFSSIRLSRRPFTPIALVTELENLADEEYIMEVNAGKWASLESTFYYAKKFEEIYKEPSIVSKLGNRKFAKK
jgi:hypothetical protein